MKLTRNELEKAVSRKTGISRALTRKVVDNLVDAITDALKDGGSVTITNLGTFKMVENGPKDYTNPRTLKKQVLPKRLRPAFKYSLNLKEKLKNE